MLERYTDIIKFDRAVIFTDIVILIQAQLWTLL